MKPRLESAPLTEEDDDIWDFVGRDGVWFYTWALEDHAWQSDRRDADLMCYFMHKRGRAGGVYEDGQWIDFSGGVNPQLGWRRYNIT